MELHDKSVWNQSLSWLNVVATDIVICDMMPLFSGHRFAFLGAFGGTLGLRRVALLQQWFV